MALRRIIGLVLAFALLSGCAASGATGGATGSPQLIPTVAATGSASVGGSASAGQSTYADIPAGRSFAEGGGGPLNYTFREEWRRARAEAQKWRSGAYLISASGEFVNDDGVPSSWSMKFVDRVNADAVLLVDIDPWGKVTRTREVTGSAGPGADRIPYSIIDSDATVGLGKAALAARYNLAKTRDPRIGLNFGTDGSGPWWWYSLFYTSTANYISVQINALTGAVTP